MYALHSFALTTALLAPLGAQHSDWTILGSTTFDAGQGLVEVGDLTIAAGATLRFVGDAPVNLRVHGTLRVDGTLDASGSGFPSSIGVTTFNTTNLQEPGRAGGPGGGRGGIGNVINFASSPIGGDGVGGYFSTGGGHGGESGFDASSSVDARRPGGGGGGALGPALPLVVPNPLDPLNTGRAARHGRDGSNLASSALDPASVPAGGLAGVVPFVDADPDNDFFGRKVVVGTGRIVVGELVTPRGGSGGGAGGNAVQSAVFPNPNWTVSSDEKGAGGAGGGGLLIVRAQLVVVGPEGRIRLDGAAGGSGENSSGINCVGGGSGGGSGGMLVLHARRIDLGAAQDACIRALGGDGGRGMNNMPDAVGAGGDGGPGLLQFHVANGANDVILPAGRTLADMTLPPAHVLLPQPGY